MKTSDFFTATVAATEVVVAATIRTERAFAKSGNARFYLLLRGVYLRSPR